ncbi:MAG: type VI secretion system tip protein TssI/VgrG [Gemmataceae bacterium]
MTPLGKDVFLVTGLHGSDSISQPFRYTIDAKTTRQTTIAFDQLLGRPLAVRLELPNKQTRYFHGICIQLMQGESDQEFSDYQFDIVPQAWLLTKKTQSRIFQHISVPDILKKVFTGLDVEYQLSGKFEPRDYCVQYRESDFNFASRLMEEEGIYYFFKHAESKHTMVIANTPQSHPVVPGESSILYKAVNQQATDNEDYIAEISKVQHQTSGKFTLWDHTFELPHQHLESDKMLPDKVMVGKVSHKLAVGDAAKLEIYDFPGEYAQRFDGIDKGGGDRAGDLAKIPLDSKRTVELRMQHEAANAVSIRGAGMARNMTSGYKFVVKTLPSDVMTTPIMCEGEYVLTQVTHSAILPATYRSSGAGGNDEGFRYSNSFQAMPSGLTFRPTRATAKPVVPGMQSAVVVGPEGEEIFTDKYGRIKVQFHWDREGKKNADSSCWMRVAQISAGRAWGMMSIPRVGQEVVVDFLEGDPDQPIVIGCVYNPDQMPMYKLPDEKTKSYIRTNSSLGGVGYNEIRIEDKAGREQVYVHAQKDMDERVRNDSKERVGNDRHMRVGFYLPNDHKGEMGGEEKKGNQYEEVAVDQHLKVHRHSEEHIGGDLKQLIGGGDGEGNVDIHIKKDKHELIDGTLDQHVKMPVQILYDNTLDKVVTGNTTQSYSGTYDLEITGQRTETVKSSMDVSVMGDLSEKVDGSVGVTVGVKHESKVGMKMAVDAGQEIHLKAGMSVVIEALQVTLKGAGGFITVGPAGVAIQGAMVLINSGGAAGAGSGASPKSPKTAKTARKARDAKDAKPKKPLDADHSKTGTKSN